MRTRTSRDARVPSGDANRARVAVSATGAAPAALSYGTSAQQAMDWGAGSQLRPPVDTPVSPDTTDPCLPVPAGATQSSHEGKTLTHAIPARPPGSEVVSCTSSGVHIRLSGNSS